MHPESQSPSHSVSEDAGASALARLWQEAAPGEHLDEEVLREKLLDDPDRDPGLWLAARHGGRVVGIAVGVVRQLPGDGGPLGYVQFLAVAPTFRRQKVATRLLDELERRLFARGARRIRVLGSAPSYLWPGVDVRYTPALCLFERRGYRIEGYEFNMSVDLTRPIQASGAGPRRHQLERLGVRVRRLEHTDETAFRAWLEQTWGPNWTYEALLALRRPVPTGFVAEQDGRIVGFAVYDSTRPGWFGPMGVEVAWQGSGVGIELCVQAFEAMAAQGYRAAEIAWAGPRCFYARKLGAVISRVFASMELKDGAG
ncbi:MAG: GNAT family N-acetyltransferase [Bacillota bacterium]